MTRAEMEAASAERWVEYKASGAVKHHGRAKSHFIAAYVQGRLDQAEADARIAEADTTWSIMGHPSFDQKRVMASSVGSERERIAAEIRKGVE